MKERNGEMQKYFLKRLEKPIFSRTFVTRKNRFLENHNEVNSPTYRNRNEQIIFQLCEEYIDYIWDNWNYFHAFVAALAF